MSTPSLDEETLNQEIRKFLKKVGIQSQREIEEAVRGAARAGALPADGRVRARMTLELGGLGLTRVIEADLELRA